MQALWQKRAVFFFQPKIPEFYCWWRIFCENQHNMPRVIIPGIFPIPNKLFRISEMSSGDNSQSSWFSGHFTTVQFALYESGVDRAGSYTDLCVYFLQIITHSECDSGFIEPFVRCGLSIRDGIDYRVGLGSYYHSYWYVWANFLSVLTILCGSL